MKTYTQSSRFIQPKKFGRCSEVPVVYPFDNLTNQSDIDSIISPQSATDFNIVEEICSLEQQYSKSVLKWDNIRKREEHEHAMMQGKALAPYSEDISANEVLAINVVGVHESYLQSDAEEEDYRRRNHMKRVDLALTSSKSSDICFVPLQRCILLYLLLLIMLRVSHLMHATNYTDQ
jgi:hypothetical protein